MACETEAQNVADVLALLQQNEAQQQALQMEQQQLVWAHEALMAQLWGAYQIWLGCLNNSQEPEARSAPDVRRPSFTEWLEGKRRKQR